MAKYNYIITIKEPDYRRADMVTFLMLLTATLFFVYVAARHVASQVFPFATVLYALLACFILAWTVYMYLRARRTGGFSLYRVALLAAAVGWFASPVSNYWIAGLYSLAALLERRVKVPQEMGVHESGISFNTLPAKEYEWKEIKNLMLKEGVLTVDYQNNKLFQHEIEAEISKEWESEFNYYCRQKLASLV